ncbi:MAG TPA: hypothetical protein VFJ16_32155 [Longimicrobium sp.]|nr:hypothetical protein [Longimicrobium sp.]
MIGRRNVLFPAVALLALSGCNDGRVGQELSKNYGDCLTLLQDSARSIDVICGNSPFAERPDTERAHTARKIAEFVRDHHPEYKGRQRVVVEFRGKKGDSKAAPHYDFGTAKLGPPAH